jgi:hypothetical protein
MAGELFPVAGCKLYIGAALAPDKEDMVAADFTTALAGAVEIDGWSSMGAVGDNAALITTALINRGRDVKQKGTANAGSMANVFAAIDDDPGQIALIAAAQASNRNNYAFRMVMNDTPATGTSPTPSERLFVGLVMSAQEAGGDANTIRNLNATIEINSNIVTVPASTGA